MPTAIFGDRVHGPAIRAIRERSGFSMAAFVDALNEHLEVSRSHMVRVELGSRGASPELIEAICRVLKVPKPTILACPDRPCGRAA
jgi:transcriptional regulator with XRE-family HTH domain